MAKRPKLPLAPGQGEIQDLWNLQDFLEPSFVDQFLSQKSLFPAGYHPADDVAAENIEDHVKVKVGPFDRSQELVDIPKPDLIGSGGQ